MTERDRLFALIESLVLRHSPSGVEHDVDALLIERFEALGLTPYSDPCGNLIVRIPGQGKGRLAITAHKDEIGASVVDVKESGRLTIRNLGGSFPWVYGEGIVDLLGDERTISGVLSFGSRHVSHASPQYSHREDAPVRWADAWVETKLTAGELSQAGVRPGTRMVVGMHRKKPFRMGDHIASYTLDNKASLAILLELAKRIRDPQPDVYLVASTKEEIGAIGALYFTSHEPVDALIALEIVPLASEFQIREGPDPVLLVEDRVSIYDDGLNAMIRAVARERAISVQLASLSSLSSDGSRSTQNGHVARAACLGFPTENTHGFEIAHLGAIENCIEILVGVCDRPAVPPAWRSSSPTL